MTGSRAPDVDVDVAVVGAGVVGLAVGAELAARLPRVVVFERHRAIGTEISSRNSEVVHAGLYYPADSLKARTCVEGRRMLYSLADATGVPYRKVGKIIVATAEDEIGSLESLRATGTANGVENLSMLTSRQVAEREPSVRATAGLLSPETGVIDSHALMGALLGRLRDRGGNVVLGTPVLGLERPPGHWRVRYRDSGGDETISARAIVNAAGLEAQSVMRLAGLAPEALGLTRFLCKGQYFDVHGTLRHAVNGLVYPSPDADLAGLGIHTVVGVSEGLRLGPDAIYADKIDYGVDPDRRQAFCDAVRPFLPALRPEHLTPAMAGIRPKLAGPGEAARDFYVAHEAQHGAPGFVNLAGIESPGLTASMAIGLHVSAMITSYLL